MKEAVKKAQEYYRETGEHAHVIDVGGTYEWFCNSYFDNGYSGGLVVWSTSWQENF